MPQFWSVTYRKEKESGAAKIASDLEVQTTDSKVCEDALEALGAVAGECRTFLTIQLKACCILICNGEIGRAHV